MGSGFENLMPLFLSEAERILKGMETACHALLDTPDDSNLRDVICRGAHTIKGSAAVMELTEVADFVAVIERSLGCFRGEPRPFDTALDAKIRESIDLTRQLVQEIAAGDGAERIADRARMAELTQDG